MTKQETKKFYCPNTNKGLKEITIPKGCKFRYFFNNKFNKNITELSIPKGCESVYYNDNKLKELTVPKNKVFTEKDLKNFIRFARKKRFSWELCSSYISYKSS